MNAKDRDAAMTYLRTLIDRDAEADALADDLHPADKAEIVAIRENARAVIDPFHLAEWRMNTALREQAYGMAAEQAARRIKDALDDLRAMNFGAAREMLRDLLENGLPNDHGGPVTHHPLFERSLEMLVEARRTER